MRLSLLALAIMSAPASQPRPQAADYSVCFTVNPAGPIGKPHRHMNVAATVSGLT